MLALKKSPQTPGVGTIAVIVISLLCASGQRPAALETEQLALTSPDLDWIRSSESKGGLNSETPQILVAGFTLEDNGDGDAWADSNETVFLTLVLRNNSGVALTGVVAQLSTADETIACIGRSVAEIGAMAHGEVRPTSPGFQFTVGDIARVDVLEELTATFTIAVSANEFPSLSVSEPVTIDLDLDAAGGTDPSQFFEGFEEGLGSFAPDPIDSALNPPDDDLDNYPAGLQNADGYRCQYTDPDWEQSDSYGESSAPTCFPNPNGRPDAFFFGTTTDRSFTGTGSLHFGTILDPPLGPTCPVSQLEAVESTADIGLGWEDVCSQTRTTHCEMDSDCPAGEACETIQPELVIKHQVSLIDHRFISAGGPTSLDRAVVLAQALHEDLTPASRWVKLSPYLNPYDTEATRSFLNCFFDPVDDGNNEEDFFDPSDPHRRLGPSSTCRPGFTFAHQGDTDEPFDAGNTGDATDGPGLEGASGPGTWVEARFDLSRFRGRRVRIRFLVSQIKIIGSEVLWEDFMFNPDPRDDGWFVDDVVITDTLATPATISVDDKPNEDIKADWDLDGVGASCDCNSNDPSAWHLPGEVQDVRLEHAGSGIDPTTLRWSPPDDLGGTGIWYRLLSSTMPHGFAVPGHCEVTTVKGNETSDPAPVPAGAVKFYLVVAEHSCGIGTAGFDSSGTMREVQGCF